MMIASHAPATSTFSSWNDLAARLASLYPALLSVSPRSPARIPVCPHAPRLLPMRSPEEDMTSLRLPPAARIADDERNEEESCDEFALDA